MILAMSATLLEHLLQCPTLPELMDDLHAVLAKEHALRQKFYHDITPEHKWEFINGEVILHSPALCRHMLAVQRLYNVMNAHCMVTKAGQMHVEKAMCSFPRNDYEPDIIFFGHGKSQLIGPDTLKFPVPDLIVEVVSPSTERRDRGVKFADYAAHGVREYWIVDPVDETVELHRLLDGAYAAAERQQAGDLASEVMAGLIIPVRAAFDEAVNLQVMRAVLG